MLANINIINNLILFSTFILSANAATIAVDNLDPDTSSSNGFTITTTTDTATDTVTYSFSQTADLDGGSIDDIFTFDLVVNAYTDSTFDGTDVTLGSTNGIPNTITPNTITQNWHNNTYDDGDTIRFTVNNISYIDGEGDEDIVFNGFSSIRSVSFDNGTVSTPTGDIDYYVGLNGAATITGDPSFNIDLITSNGASDTLYLTAGGGPVRLRDLDFTFDTVPVPEPSSAILLGLGLSGVMLHRKRA